jgi:hypothetical protein
MAQGVLLCACHVARMSARSRAHETTPWLPASVASNSSSVAVRAKVYAGVAMLGRDASACSAVRGDVHVKTGRLTTSFLQ